MPPGHTLVRTPNLPSRCPVRYGQVVGDPIRGFDVDLLGAVDYDALFSGQIALEAIARDPDTGRMKLATDPIGATVDAYNASRYTLFSGQPVVAQYANRAFWSTQNLTRFPERFDLLPPAWIVYPWFAEGRPCLVAKAAAEIVVTGGAAQPFGFASLDGWLADCFELSPDGHLTLAEDGDSLDRPYALGCEFCWTFSIEAAADFELRLSAIDEFYNVWFDVDFDAAHAPGPRSYTVHVDPVTWSWGWPGDFLEFFLSRDSGAAPQATVRDLTAIITPRQERYL